ncbi:MAG: J domain-containing protein [Alphaproteobacteria bacterium]|nr:J domain-containing protein [Alphaproteobacteria bacterium]MCB9974799.1 J domain-containing protein [Rhodospirillales bacterium]
MPGCTLHAEHKAPKDRALKDYYWFCFDHVKEYNRAWDFFSGMNSGEIEDHIHNSFYGDRPTWRYDMNKGSAEDFLYRKAWQTCNFTENDPQKEQEKNWNKRQGASSVTALTPEREALSLMGLEEPVTLEEIKRRYKTLAKKHHPDLNRGCSESEELLKRVNMAYTILKLAYEKYEALVEKES